VETSGPLPWGSGSAHRRFSQAALQVSPSEMLPTSTRRQKPLGLPSEAFAQAGRMAKSMRSTLPAFDLGVTPRLPLSWPRPQHRLRRYAVAGPQVTPGREDDAAMLVAASSRLGRGTTGPKSAQGWELQSGQNVFLGGPPKVPQFAENDPSPNSRAPARR